MPGPPLILYVPGMLPKPPPELHREQLTRCMLASLDRVDPKVAQSLRTKPGAIDLVSWTWDFYAEHREIELDLDDIESALARTAPDLRDRAEADNWRRRLMHAAYNIADRFPFLISRLANEKVEVHLRDLRRYVRNENGIADHVRRLLKVPLQAAYQSGRPVMLLAHSMGSVIAWDTLWELTRDGDRSVSVDRWLTIGSPLGGHYLQKRLFGLNRMGAERYPGNVRRWTNIAAVGETTALDRTLGNDFGEMVELGLVEDIEDIEIYSYYRMSGALNVHNEYGYLMHDTTATVIGDWWRSVEKGG